MAGAGEAVAALGLGAVDGAGAAEEDGAAVAEANAAGVAGPPATRVSALGFTLVWNAVSAVSASCGSSVSWEAPARSPLAQAARKLVAPVAARPADGASATTVRTLGVLAELLPEPTRVYAP
ncbi:hypothetical protein P3T34_004664 [Kitasatospora sp. MAP12-44]|uniref:hypothetical protein n=1 Tax=Kitasatospora sp. MAP12-44 TaxID=3035099 RepID=UPI002476DF9D|nr:hypothetical protein [Kitasatospora sp. MAP12-44]MDH6112449.1 hypothetical protein [Kitasatospora sp. MAP12-44]